MCQKVKKNLCFKKSEIISILFTGNQSTIQGPIGITNAGIDGGFALGKPSGYNAATYSSNIYAQNDDGSNTTRKRNRTCAGKKTSSKACSNGPKFDDIQTPAKNRDSETKDILVIDGECIQPSIDTQSEIADIKYSAPNSSDFGST